MIKLEIRKTSKRLKTLLIFILLTSTVAAQVHKKIIVAKDGTGNYTSVQQAFDAVPLNNKVPVDILIKPGIYKEKLLLDSSKDFITVKGEDAATTIITYDDHTGKMAPDGTLINTMNSQTFYIKANDFKAENITFENNAGMTAGQAVAVRVQGDRAVFLNCRFIGFQDTLFTSGENSRQYYRDCYIEGSTDFIFGASTVLFDACTLRSKKNSHVTAASTPKEHPYGYVFRKCELVADTGITKVSLGRPWRPYASVTYIECNIGAHILPQGWDNWKNPENEKTTRYAEYKNTGPGALITERAVWTKQLTTEEAKLLTMENIFGDWRPAFKK